MNLKIKFKLLIFLLFIMFILIAALYDFQKKQDLYYQDIFKKYNDMQALQDVIDKTYAEGVIVYDLNSDKILGGKNINKTYSMASLTKIITAVSVYEKDKTLLNDIRNMLKRSSNEEADRLSFILAPARDSQVDYINNFTKKYKLYFRNTTGLDIDNMLAGGEGKPKDINNFIKDYYLKYPELFDETIRIEDNTNVIAKDLNFLTAGKTGFTNLSGGNLFVIIQKGLHREISILVLNSTEKNRFVDVQNVADFLLQSNI